MKSRLGLILAGSAVVLTLLLTAGKVIETEVVIRRVIVNVILFYLIGIGLELFYKKYLLGIIKESEGDPSRVSMSDSDLESIVNDPNVSPSEKGINLDFKVGDEDLTADLAIPLSDEATSQNQEPASATQEEGSSKLDAMADKVAGTSKKSVPFENKFEVRDDFILINDKKIPNNAKLMAEAIKTKLSE
jgi:uncharacterized protein (UPF0147 family)